MMEVMEMEDEPDYERLYEEYIKPVIPDMTHEVVDQILGTGETTWGLTFEVIRQGDKWVVDDMSAPELEVYARNREDVAKLFHYMESIGCAA